MNKPTYMKTIRTIIGIPFVFVSIILVTITGIIIGEDIVIKVVK